MGQSPHQPSPAVLLYNLTTSCRFVFSGDITLVTKPAGGEQTAGSKPLLLAHGTSLAAQTAMNPVSAKFTEVESHAHKSRLGQRTITLVGNTPLLRLERIAREFPNVQVLAKAEWYNPGGSVKDRAAFNIIFEGRRSGKFASGRTLLDSTSGNTGIAYAMIGAAEGFPVTLCMPENVSVERKRILFAYGANIIYTPADEGSDGAIRVAREIYAREPEKYFYADQYSSDANWQAHYHGTAKEIWQQTEGRVTHFVAMLGTSGTFMGTSRRLKELNPDIRCTSLQPDSPFHGIEGAKHMASAIVPKIYDPALADEDLAICTEDAYAMAIRLSHEEGLLIGISAGAAVAGCMDVARRLKEGEEAVIVTIFPDSGDKYLSERFWTET